MDRARITQLSWDTLWRAGMSLAFVARLASRIRRLRPDIVYANSLKAGILGGLAARIVGVPLVWHVHDRISSDYMPPRSMRMVHCAIRTLATIVVANSAATGAMVHARNAPIVAYPGFAPDQALPKFYERPDRTGRPVVGLLGRISPTKGQLEFVRAARKVSDERPEARFQIIGSPLFGAERYDATVRAEIVRLGLESEVEIIPFTHDPVAALDRLTICVHASPVPEPFGQVVLEAMLRGVSVVATDAGGVPEILQDGPECLGKLVPPGDEEAMAHAILTLLGDPKAASEIARRGYASARRRFPIEETVERVTEAWCRAAGLGQ